MASTTRDNVVPLYFNSADRLNIDDSTTDYTIRLRKTLGNISSISITDVGIPTTYTNVSTNNNTFDAAFFDGSNTTAFTVSVPPLNYSVPSLATALQLALNQSPVSLANELGWLVDGTELGVGSVPSGQFSLEVVWTPGRSVESWGVDITYTTLVDVLGLGNGGTTTSSDRVSFNDVLTITVGRVSALYNNLKINVTSSALTEDINTSYISSLGKSFTVSDTNHTLVLATQQTLTGYVGRAPALVGVTGVINEGRSVAISAAGDIIVAGGYSDAGGRGASFVYQQLSIDGPYLQRVGKIVGLGALSTFPGEGFVVALSGDGRTLAAAAPTDSYISGGATVTNGACWVYTRSGTSWVQEAKLVVPAIFGSRGSGGGRTCSLSGDGNVMATVATAVDAPGIYFYRRVGSTWGEPYYVYDSQFDVEETEVSTAVSGDGFTVAASSIGRCLVYVADADPAAPWVVQQSIIGGGPVSLSNDGNTIVVADSSALGGGGIYTRAAGVYTMALSFAAAPGVQSGCVSGDGVTVAVGIPTPSGGSVIVYRLVMGAWGNDATILPNGVRIGQVGISVALSSNGSDLVFGGSTSESGLGGSWLWKRESVSGTWYEVYGKDTEAHRLLQGNDTVSVVGAGKSIAVSRDTSILAVGIPYNTTVFGNTAPNAGGVAMYTRVPNGEWTQIEPILTGYDTRENGLKGWAVAMSSDGAWVIAGAPGGTTGGAAEVWNRFGATYEWQPAQSYEGITFNTTVSFGWSVAISNDGQVRVIGDPDYCGGDGAFFIITLASPFNIIQKVYGVAEQTRLGWSVTLSGDGNTLAIGIPAWKNPSDISPIGNVAIWVRDASTGLWESQTSAVDAAPPPTDALGNGTSVALSDDGNTLVSGAPSYVDPGGVLIAGAIYIYTRAPDLTWGRRQKIPPIAPSTPFGQSVAITGDALIVAQGGGIVRDISSFAVNSGVSIYRYNLPTETWLPYGAPTIRGASTITDSVQGTSVALCYVPGTTEFQVEFGGVTNTWGDVWTFLSNGSAPVDYTSIIPNGSYSVYALINVMTTVLQFQTVHFTASFNNITGSITLSVIGDTGVAATFTVAASSTFTDIFLLPLATLPKAPSITSLPLDFTINNNVIKSLNSHLTEGAPFIYDTSVNTIYRKYRAGFTLSVDEVIDIQLRDERDRIIDLNGSNWIMTVNASIHT